MNDPIDLLILEEFLIQQSRERTPSERFRDLFLGAPFPRIRTHPNGMPIRRPMELINDPAYENQNDADGNVSLNPE